MLVLAATLPQITALINAIVWPIVVVVVLVTYRRELPRLVRGLTARLSRVSFAGAAVDLAPASEAAPAVLSAARGFIDATATAGFQDSAPALRVITRADASDFAKIDLGSGHSWLTSRLFIFSLILGGTAGVRRLVFLQRSAEGIATFVGVADPLVVAARLATRFPWLSYALSDATELSGPRKDAWSPPFADPAWAEAVGARYLVHPLIRSAPYRPNPDPTVQFYYTEDSPVDFDASPSDPQPLSAADVAREGGSAQQPSVRSISPSSGSPSGGTRVTITGTALDGVSTVWFTPSSPGASGGDKPAVLESVQPTEVRAVSPPGFGIAQVQLVIGTGTTLHAEFVYTSHPLPLVSSVGPLSGPCSGGTKVTIIGSGLSEVKQVRFGDSPAIVTTATETEIETVAPPGNGIVPITVRTASGSSTTSDDWVSVPSAGPLHAEHAAWIRDGQHLVSLLADAVDRTCVVQTLATKRADLSAEILRAEDDFAVIVDREHQFQRLIDRRRALEELAREAAEGSQ
jgi:hypothetical protein